MKMHHKVIKSHYFIGNSGLLMGILCFFSLLTYMWSWHYPFQFDDYQNIITHFNTTTKWFFSSSRWVGYGLNHFLHSYSIVSGGVTPFYYRIVCFCIHLTTGLLLFSALIRLQQYATRQSFFREYGLCIAFAAAGLFLLHPVQTQTVSYVIQCELEGLAALFLLLQIQCFISYCGARTSSKKITWVCALFLTTLIASGTKESIIVAPLLLLLIDWFFIAQGNYKDILKSRGWLYITLSSIMLCSFLYYLGIQKIYNFISLQHSVKNNIGNMLTTHPHDSITSYNFCISQARVILHYLLIFIWPFSLCVEYDWKLASTFFSTEVLVPLSILTALLAYIVYRLQQNRIDLFSAGIIWFFIATLPRASIIPCAEMLADYKTYIPSLGILTVLGALFVYLIILVLQRIPVANKQRVITLCTCCLLISSALISYVRNKIWSSEKEFWMDAMKHAPDKARPYNLYGVALFEENKLIEALPYFKEAIKRDPYYPDPRTNCAIIYALQGNNQQAITELKTAIAVCPAHPESYYNLALIQQQEKNYEEAFALFKYATKLAPRKGQFHFNFGKFLLEINNLAAAHEEFKKACLQANFNTVQGFSTYTQISFSLGKYEEALVGVQAWLKRTPQSPEALLYLQEIHKKMGA